MLGTASDLPGRGPGVSRERRPTRPRSETRLLGVFAVRGTPRVMCDKLPRGLRGSPHGEVNSPQIKVTQVLWGGGSPMFMAVDTFKVPGRMRSWNPGILY